MDLTTYTKDEPAIMPEGRTKPFGCGGCGSTRGRGTLASAAPSPMA